MISFPISKSIPPYGGIFFEGVPLRWASVVFLFALQIASSSPCRASDWSITPFIDVGGVSDGGRSPSLYEKVGLQFSKPLSKGIALEAAGAYSRYSITYFGLPYTTFQSGAGTVKAARFPLREDKLDYFAAASFPAWSKKGLEIDLRAGYRGVSLLNDLSTFHMGGPLLGIEGRALLSRGELRLRGDAAPNLFSSVENHRKDLAALNGSKSVSLFGEPVWVLNYSVEGWMPTQKGRKIGIGYKGETLFFQRTERFYHGIFLAVTF